MGGAQAKLKKQQGEVEREEREKGRERKRGGKKTTGNKGMTSSNIPCYIRAE